MQADATMFAIGYLIRILVGCVVLLWAAKSALRDDGPFQIEFRSLLFSFTTKPAPGLEEAPDERSYSSRRRRLAPHAAVMADRK
jgi:hypothetical protein